ncbi:MAG: SoxR reducing system RseC family protein [Bacteroidales bacterium]|nr:SoxR reducing system RseC family protein [Bacteroidales bacterium]
METIVCRTEQQVTHRGTVVSAAPGEVRVRILRLSGCASCAAHARCGLSEQKETIITVPTDRWQEYHEGDAVTVAVGSGRGMMAVAIAYVLPAVLLLAVFVLCHAAGLSEPLSALVTLGAVALYMGILYLLRRNVNRRFEFRFIEPTEE